MAAQRDEPDQDFGTPAALKEELPARRVDLKALFAAAPLEGIDLGRENDAGRGT